MIENCHLPAKRSKAQASSKHEARSRAAAAASHKQSKSHNQNKRIAIAIDSLLVASLAVYRPTYLHTAEKAFRHQLAEKDTTSTQKAKKNFASKFPDD